MHGCRVPLATGPSLVWPGLAWCGLAWPGVAWPGVAWPSLAWPSVAWRGLAWPGLDWSGLAWPGPQTNVVILYFPKCIISLLNRGGLGTTNSNIKQHMATYSIIQQHISLRSTPRHHFRIFWGKFLIYFTSLYLIIIYFWKIWNLGEVRHPRGSNFFLKSLSGPSWAVWDSIKNAWMPGTSGYRT